jgi:hypothetical protein
MVGTAAGDPSAVGEDADGRVLAAARVTLPPAICRRRIMDKSRPDWLPSMIAPADGELTPDVVGCATGTAVGAEGGDEFPCAELENDALLCAAKLAGKAALRSPVRVRSVAGGSAVLPADSARRRSRDAARPPNELEEAVCMSSWTVRDASAIPPGRR